MYNLWEYGTKIYAESNGTVFLGMQSNNKNLRNLGFLGGFVLPKIIVGLDAVFFARRVDGNMGGFL